MQNYVVQKQLISIHSEDRDIKKWPSSTIFDVELPVEYKNIVSLRLSDIELPSNYYVFSLKNQNVKFTVSLNGMVHSITIMEGTYSPYQLALELTGQLNKMYSVTTFQVYYNTVSMKFIFINTTHSFSINFSFAEPYDAGSFYDQYTQWGFGSYLGFGKALYDSAAVSTYSIFPDNIITSGNVIEAPFTANLFGDSHIYMELDLYNSMDEIAPYTERSNHTFNAKYSGKHNSAFAKIPTIAVANHKLYVSKESFLSNLFFSDPPLERVQKFKFRFRYHDGRPVDFGTTNFSFTIEITMLRPDSMKQAIQVNSNHYKLR
jgi:hypothetical protein